MRAQANVVRPHTSRVHSLNSINSTQNQRSLLIGLTKSGSRHADRTQLTDLAKTLGLQSQPNGTRLRSLSLDSANIISIID